MNEEIKQLIEEESRNRYLEYLHGTSNEKEFLSMTDLLPLHDAIKACEITVNFILSKWQEANRWRNVEEEMPEESFGTFMAGKYEYTADKFLVKTRNNKYSLASRCRFLGHSVWEWEGSCTFKSSIIEWKPIT